MWSDHCTYCWFAYLPKAPVEISPFNNLNCVGPLLLTFRPLYQHQSTIKLIPTPCPHHSDVCCPSYQHHWGTNAFPQLVNALSTLPTHHSTFSQPVHHFHASILFASIPATLSAHRSAFSQPVCCSLLSPHASFLFAYIPATFPAHLNPSHSLSTPPHYPCMPFVFTSMLPHPS